MLQSSLILVVFYLVASLGFSQEVKDSIPDQNSHTEIRSLKEFFEKSHFHGHVRNHFMVTNNFGSLNDYYANATGAALGFNTAQWKGLYIGIKGIFTYNTFSNDLNEEDSLVHASALWEKELFDVLQPQKKSDLDRLDELFISYHYRKLTFILGKQDINEGPLLQRRDTRMKPFVYKGFYSKWEIDSLTTMSGAFFTHVSPRGTTEWFTLSEAIGLFNNGKTEEGDVVNYHEAVPSIYLFEHGIIREKFRKYRLEIWNYHLSGVSHTIWLESRVGFKKWHAGVQYAQQIASQRQLELPINERYFPFQSSQTVAFQIGRHLSESVECTIATLHSIGDGSFLFPRELNRDAFFTSLPRSRVDGIGKQHVYTLKFDFRPEKKGLRDLKAQLAVQIMDLPDILDYTHNKYGLPSYAQLNAEVNYHFHGSFDGLRLSFLYLLRSSSFWDPLLPVERFNKTDFHHFNVILNIVF